MRYVFKSLFIKKWFVILTIIQMVFGFILLNNALLLSKSLLNREIIVNRLIGNAKMIHLSNYSSEYTRSTESTKNNLLKLVDYMKSSKDIEWVGSFKNSEILIKRDNDNKFQNSDMIIDLEDENGNSVEFLSIPAVFIDDDMYNMVKIDIAYGRAFTSADFNLNRGLEIPVIIGQDLSKYYKIDDVIAEGRDTQDRILSKYKIVGILKKGQMFMGGDSTLSSLQVKGIDNTILIPFSREDSAIDDFLVRFGINCSYRIKNDADVSRVMNDVDKKCSELNLSLKSIRYTDEIKEINRLSNEGIFYNVFLAIMLTFFSLLGVISSVMLSILKNREEYGIRMAVGARPKDISKGIFLEMLVIFIATILIANLIMIIFPKLLATQLSQKSDYLVFVISSIIIFAVAQIASIIPVKRINKLDVSDLLRRGE